MYSFIIVCPDGAIMNVFCVELHEQEAKENGRNILDASGTWAASYNGRRGPPPARPKLTQVPQTSEGKTQVSPHSSVKHLSTHVSIGEEK